MPPVDILTSRERAALRKRLDRRGWKASARNMGISYNTLKRAVAGEEPVLPGTLALLRNALAETGGADG